MQRTRRGLRSAGPPSPVALHERGVILQRKLQLHGLCPHRTPCSSSHICELRRPLFPDFDMAPLRSPGVPQQWAEDPGLESSSDSGVSDQDPDDPSLSGPSYGPGYRDVNSSSVDPTAALGWSEWAELHWVPLALAGAGLLLVVCLLGHSGGLRRGFRYLVELLLYSSAASCLLCLLLLRSLWEAATRPRLPPGPELLQGPEGGPHGPEDGPHGPEDVAEGHQDVAAVPQPVRPRALLLVPRDDHDLLGPDPDDPGDLLGLDPDVPDGLQPRALLLAPRDGGPQVGLLHLGDHRADAPREAPPAAGGGVEASTSNLRGGNEGLDPDGPAPASISLSLGVDEEGHLDLAASGGGPAPASGQGSSQ